MSSTGQAYTSGNWTVREGSEDDFVERWKAFVGWAADNVAGAGSFLLIRDSRDPRRFVSLGAWDDAGSVNDWRSRPEFAEYMGRCRELCDDFQAGDFTLTASVP